MSGAAQPVGGSDFAAALALHEQGRLDDAERLYRMALAADPDDVAALLHLGVLRLQQGRCEEAVELSRAALAREPGSAEGHSNLGAALHLLGRPEEAVAAYEASLALDAERPEAHYGLAAALHALARWDEAMACYERALVIDPDYAEASCGLGAALHALKRSERAIACYDAALAIDPDYIEALCGRGEALLALRRHDEAIAAYERAVAADPRHAGALGALGSGLQAANRHDEALAPLRRALAIDPGSGETLLKLGAVLEELGRIAEAREAFAAAVAIEPDNIRFRVALAGSKRMADSDPDLAVMEEWARNLEARSEEEQVLLHFGLGKALADIGRNDEAFGHLLAGNELKRRRIDYDERATLAAIGQIAAAFGEEAMQRAAGAGHPSAATIFIVGMPRSGSTLIEQVLASHPDVAALGERQDFGDAVRSVGGRVPLPELARDLAGDRLYRLGAAYVERIGAGPGSASAKRITDKMLANFCFVGLIHLALPNARIIHSRRDPIDTCLSCFAQLFGAEQPFAYDLGELGRYYRSYAALMEHWRRVLPAGVMLDADYERVVGDFETQARRILAFCGLDWDPACLAFHKTERVVRTASVTQVRQPIYSSSVGKWRPADELLRPLFDGLGPGLLV